MLWVKASGATAARRAGLVTDQSARTGAGHHQLRCRGNGRYFPAWSAPSSNWQARRLPVQSQAYTTDHHGGDLIAKGSDQRVTTMIVMTPSETGRPPPSTPTRAQFSLCCPCSRPWRRLGFRDHDRGSGADSSADSYTFSRVTSAGERLLVLRDDEREERMEGRAPTVGELGGVLQNKDRSLARHAVHSGRSRMAGQRPALGDARVVEETIGRLRRRPIPARRRDRLTRCCRHLIKQAAQPARQALVQQPRRNDFIVKPACAAGFRIPAYL